MARYRRNFTVGGTFFFTVKLANPKSRLLVEHVGFAYSKRRSDTCIRQNL
ncbi:hypothetical protein RSJ68_03050 [Neisseria sp. DTU_2020_1000833_1_SI_GRL_NUU_006]|nr:hypothetical protein RSJ68_03050 [Neisseria sp. DTU_2020_1000833_1_SI_GRL_NUU_006]